MAKRERIEKQSWKPGNVLSPAPPVLVSCGGTQGWKPNLITIAWAGNVCSDPPMLSISVRPERYSYEIIRTTREFVVNVPSLRQARAVDWCGVVSGRNEDKFAGAGLTPAPALKVQSADRAGVSAQHRMPGEEIPGAGLAYDVRGGGGRRAGLGGSGGQQRGVSAWTNAVCWPSPTGSISCWGAASDGSASPSGSVAADGWPIGNASFPEKSSVRIVIPLQVGSFSTRKI